MNKLFERIMPLNCFSKIIKKPLTLITSYAPEDRNEVIANSLNYDQKFILDYSMEVTSLSTTNSTIIDILSVIRDGCQPIKYNSFDTDQLNSLIQIIINGENDILINITGFHIRLLGMLLSGIKDKLTLTTKNTVKIYCGYTEPNEYVRNNISQMFGSILNNEGELIDSANSRRFNFYKKFANIEPIPTLASIGLDDDIKQTWIVLLGFEGERPNRIQSELSKVDDVIALITVPPLKPGWNNFALDENSHFLEGVDSSPIIEYISAYSPFSVYNFLYDYKSKYPDERILISPLSTRATSLGAILYAINNPECALIFDNPYETQHKKSNSFGKTHIFDISEAIYTQPLDILCGGLL